MSDPAVEAAQRTMATRSGLTRVHAEAAAREALAPIREMVEMREEFGDEVDVDDLKALLYTTEELADEWTDE